MADPSKALGMIETWGLPALIAAADAAAKTADVQVKAYEKADAGIVTVYVLGDVASVQTAVLAGGEAAKRVGKLLATHVIPRPDASLFASIEALSGPRSSSAPAATDPLELPEEPNAFADIPLAQAEVNPQPRPPTPGVPADDLGQWKVKQLRELAMQSEGFPMSAAQIAKAGKAELLRLLSERNTGERGGDGG